MTDTELTIGAEACCSDGSCGHVRRVVVDPIARSVTHLVVEPDHRSGLGRLVPLDLVEEATPDRILLRCTLDEVARMPPAEETDFLPAGDSYGGYQSGDALAWPYVGLGGSMGGMVGGGMAGGFGLGVGNITPPTVHDTLPLGEVAVRRGQPVRATDGDIGRVQALVVDRDSRHVTHVLLQEGHLWGRKQVAIPISAVTQLDDGIAVDLTKQAVGDLPPVDVEHPAV